MEQRPVPPDMDLVQMTGGRPQLLARRHPAEPVLRPTGHLHHMRDRVMRPETQGFEFGGGARFVFGAGVIAGFLRAEGVEGEQRGIAALVLRPERQGPRRPVADPMKASEETVDQDRALMRHEIERVTHQVAVERRDGGGAGALQPMVEGREVTSFAFVQRQRPGGVDEGRDGRHEAGVVGGGQDPGLAEMRHREAGCGLSCRVEPADRIAADEVERPHRLVVGGGGLGRGAGEAMSVGVLDHARPQIMPCAGATGGPPPTAAPPRSPRGGRRRDTRPHIRAAAPRPSIRSRARPR